MSSALEQQMLTQTRFLQSSRYAESEMEVIPPLDRSQFPLAVSPHTAVVDLFAKNHVRCLFVCLFVFMLLQVRLSDDDVERERSIVEEEWRQGRGCAQRATEDFFKLVVKGR